MTEPQPTPSQPPRRARRTSGLARPLLVGTLAAPQALAGAPPAAQGPPDPFPALVAPLSGGLGLADITVELPEPPTRSLTLAVVFTGRDGTLLHAPLVALDPAQPRRLSARIMAGPPAPPSHPDSPITFRIESTDADGRRLAGPEHAASCAPPAGAATPDWAKGAVWYQVFVERFRNGNPANDPRPPEFFLAPWSSDYHAVGIDELELARARAAGSPVPRSLDPRRRGGQLGNVLPDRRYGGDLEGVVEKLDELQDLGVTAIYLNPIFQAHSAHKYDAGDYRHVDPAFAGPGRSQRETAALAQETPDPATWTFTAADRYFFDTLAPEVHRRGLRLVLDGVWNHTGTDFWAFRDIKDRGVDSPYRSWYTCEFSTPASCPDWSDATLDLRPGRLIGWKSWGGGGRNGNLPEFARDAETGRLQPDVERHIFEIARRWSPAIDGWRLDVVPDMPRPFWRAWSDHVRDLNPDAALFAEVWFDAKDYFSPVPTNPERQRAGQTAPNPTKTFDGQMNYPFAYPAVRWLSGEPGAPSDRLASAFRRVFSHAPQHDLVQMNLLGSHDTERLASMLANPGRDYDQRGSVATNPRYDAGRPSPEVYRRVALAAALQAVVPGSPMIYYGDEYGMYGGDDPDCRKPLPWPDLGPYSPPSPTEAPGPPLPALREHFRAWLRLRTAGEIGPVLRYGNARFSSLGADAFVVERRLNDRIAVAVLNRSTSTALDATDRLPALANLKRVLGEAHVPPLGASIWFGGPIPHTTRPGPARRPTKPHEFS